MNGVCPKCQQPLSDRRHDPEFGVYEMSFCEYQHADAMTIAIAQQQSFFSSLLVGVVRS
jgi:hypothetical protein